MSKNARYKIKNGSGSYDIIHFETSASQVKFADGKTFQDKLNSGELRGQTGPKGANGEPGKAGERGVPGPPGAAGATGKDGAKGATGVSMRLVGEWSSSTSYVNNTTHIDLVTYQGSTYACKTSNQGQNPTSSSHWTLVAKKGDTGARGAAGEPGKNGATGPVGPAGKEGAKGAAGAAGPAGAMGPQGPAGARGATGFTWRPSVDGSGNLTWTQDNNSSAPGKVNIKGAQGTAGPAGARGNDGATGPRGPEGPNIISTNTNIGSGISSGHFLYANGSKVAAKALTHSTIGAAAASHTHDNIYFTQSAINSKLATYVLKAEEGNKSFSSTFNKIENPVGANYVNGSSDNKGYIKITLPVSWNNTMIKFTLNLYDYQNGGTSTYEIGGYNYSDSGGQWINCSAACVHGANYPNRHVPVQFGHDGSKCAIYIGESASTSWPYLQAHISNLTVSFSGGNLGTWKNGWRIEVTKTLGTIKTTITNPSVSGLIRNVGNATTPIYFNGDGKAVALPAFNHRTGSVTDLNWGTAPDNSAVTTATMAYWNGAYKGSSSNLRYCSQGAFGNIVTRSASEFAPASHGTHVPSPQSANNKVFLRNDNTWQTISPANIGAADRSHNHTSLLGTYVSGGRELPNYFGSNNLKLQMLNTDWGWADTLWMSSYGGGDVKGSNQLVVSKGGNRIGFRTQNYDSSSWGTLNEIYHTGKKPTASEIGAADRSHSHSEYLPTGGTAANSNKLSGKSMSEGASASTIVCRDGAADINARLFRSNYANQSTISGAIAYRVNNGSDNYLRYCSDTNAIRNWLGAAPASHSHSYAPTSHSHNDLYYTKGEINNSLGGKANSNHSHSGYLSTSGGTVNGTFKVGNSVIQAYRYGGNTNAAAITMDKPGDGCFGIGANGQSMQIQYGRVDDMNGAWSGTQNLTHVFKGQVEAVGGNLVTRGGYLYTDTGTLWMGNDDRIWFNDSSNYFNFYADGSIGNAGIDVGRLMVKTIHNNGSNIDIDLGNRQSIWINTGSATGSHWFINSNWAGGSGTECCLYSSRSGGYGFVGANSNPLMQGYAYSWVTKSHRKYKYNIAKTSNEQMYDYVKDLNIYTYRHDSSSVNPDTDQFEENKRLDLQLGCIVDELPLEVVNYDMEGGDGTGVDLYSYTTMVLGATKALQDKVEALESEKEELMIKLMEMEEKINGIINGR